MSQDEMNPQRFSEGDESVEKSVGCEGSLAGDAAAEGAKEGSLAGDAAAAEGAKEGSLAGDAAAAEGAKEGSLAGDAASKSEEFDLSNDPSVLLDTVVDQLQIITITLVNTVKVLKRIGNKYPKSFAALLSFKGSIEVILKEIESVFKNQEKVLLQTNKTQTDPEANVEDSVVNAGVVEGTDVTVCVASESSSAKEASEREMCISQIALEYVEKVVQAAKIKMEHSAGDAKTTAEVKVAAESAVVEKAEDAEKEKADLKDTSLTGKYTSIVETHELSSSDVSATSEPTHSAQAVPQKLHSQDMNVVGEQIESRCEGSSESCRSGVTEEQIVNLSRSDESLGSPNESNQQ